jgi:DNA-binding Lrp family transcriptional regulator
LRVYKLAFEVQQEIFETPKRFHCSADRVMTSASGSEDSDKIIAAIVTAVIEVKITPERGSGFDWLATRIARFREVESCYLMSGGYDLLVVVEGADLQEIAKFVAEKLSTVKGVISTTSHFRLKTYKENGTLLERDPRPQRLPVAP